MPRAGLSPEQDASEKLAWVDRPMYKHCLGELPVRHAASSSDIRVWRQLLHEGAGEQKGMDPRERPAWPCAVAA